MKVIKTQVEYRENPLGIDQPNPRFFWKLCEEGYDKYQKAYQIQVAKDEAMETLVWDTGKRNSSDSIQISYEGEPLVSCQKYYYRIRVWDQDDAISPYSAIGSFETAFLKWQEWEADWITPEYDFQAEKTACPILRREFQLGKAVKKARIYVTAKGTYELYLNGEKVGKDYLTPGWTSYNKRLLYQTYDVTEGMKIGANAMGVMIGSGWYKGELGWRGRRNLYGGREALILELHIEYQDGTKEKILTDESWQSSYRSPILFAENYHGETYDARRESRSFEAGLDTREWFGVRRMGKVTKEVLKAQECECVRIKEIRKPKNLFQTPKGEYILDMGQNMTGWIQFRVRGHRGEKVVLSHGEILDPDGNFYTENLKGARQRIEYILKGEEQETYRPHFTFQGFRYVKIEEYPGEPSMEDFEGLVLYSDLEQTGEFSCSEPLINRLFQNVLWSQKGNFVDIPTDCPQRCERLGWTADIQIFSATAAWNMKVPLFLTKWLHDLKAEQFESGGVPWVVPDISDDTYAYDLAGYWGQSEQVAAAWGDAAVICPWVLYQYYGDTRILEQQYESMKAYIKYIQDQGENPYLWDTGHQLGDWVALDAPYGSFVGATDTAYVATAYYAGSTKILAETAKVLEKKEEEAYYRKLHENIRTAFRKTYMQEDGMPKVLTQTALVLALKFELVEETERQKLADTLADWLEKTDHKLITGFVGTPYICQVLTMYGHEETALRMLHREEYPSWLYQVTKGATTVWEHLDGLKPDGTLWNPRMNSFNHYAYGSIGQWLYEGLAGLRAEAPGFKKFSFAPVLDKALTYVQVSYESSYGRIEAKWERKQGGVQVSLLVPVNTTVRICLPADCRKEISVNGKDLKKEEVPWRMEWKTKGATLEAGSGRYSIWFQEGERQ